MSEKRMDTAYAWAPITKAEKQADGTMLVTGRVSDDGLDRDKQKCDAAWLDTAVPQWFAEGGNVREMHGSLAAGKALEHWKADDGGHMVTARVVDAGSVSKVEHGVLTGFSVGIKQPRITKSLDAPNGRIVGGQIIEVSLVDRPANPSCTLVVAKADAEGHADVIPVAEQELVEISEGPVGIKPPPMRTPVVKADEPEPIVADRGDQQPETDNHPAQVISESADTVRVAAQGVLDAIASLDLPPWVKDDEISDITDAKRAIAIIAQLIQSEATGLAEGDLNERYDIGLLLDAVAALRWFIASEQDESVDDALDALGLADKVKAEQPDPQIVDVPEGAVLTKADLTVLVAELTAKTESIVAEALTKADEAHKAEIADAVKAATDPLRDELAKVKAQPVAGGPVRIRTTEDRVKADNADRASLLAQAAEFEAKADLTDDRHVSDGYRANARRLREKAS